MTRRKKLVLAVVASCVMLGAFAAILLVHSTRSAREQKVKSNATLALESQVVGLTVRRDASLVEQPISNEHQSKGQLWELTQPQGSQEEFVVNAFYEQGAALKKLTGYTRQSLRDSVMVNVNSQLPKQYPGYKELTQRNLTIGGIEANETIFEYTSSGVRVKQRLVLLFKNSDTAVYLRAQARADQYDSVNRRYFDPLFSGISFN